MKTARAFGLRFAAWVGLCLLVACGAPGVVRHAQGRLKVEPLAIDTARGRLRFQVEVADSERERSTGMMYRTTLARDAGMLFVFPRAEGQIIWMKNTPIPLDIVFIGADGRIESIAREARPLSESLIRSQGPVSGVLELRGGRTAALGIEAGDRVRHRALPD